jgi:hypothetical protein
MLNKMLVVVLLAAYSAAIGISRAAPAALRVGAEGDPFVFAMLLAHASVPSGVVLSESATQHPPGPPDFTFKRGPTISTEELAKVFNARHPQYRAVLIDDVFVIGPAGGLPSYLNRTSGLQRMEIVGVMSATRRVLAALDPAFARKEGGILGSTINLDAEQRGDSTRIVFDGTERRVIDGLNTIAKQAGRTWLVVTSDDVKEPGHLKVGFMHPGGASTLQDVKVMP